MIRTILAVAASVLAARADFTLAAAQPPLKIPAVQHIRIDGSLDEWSDRTPLGDWNLDERIVYGKTNFQNADDLGGQCWAGWDNEFLYLAARVIDETHSQEQSGEEIWRGDHVMLLLDADRGGDIDQPAFNADDFQIGLSPGSLKESGDFLARRLPETFVWLPLYVNSAGITVEAKKTARGYDIEAAIPWSFLRITPSDGHVIALDVCPSDNDSPEAVQQTLASLRGGAWTIGTTDRLIEAVLIGAAQPVTRASSALPTAIVLLRDEVKLQPGEARTIEFQIAATDDESVPVLQFEARLLAGALSGAAYALAVQVNQQPVGFDRVLDRPREVRFARGDSQPLDSNLGWTLFYSPDFRSLHADRESEYYIPPGPFNGYRFSVDLRDLLRGGKNVVVLRYNAGSITNRVGLRDVQVKWVTPAQAEAMRAVEAQAAPRTPVRVAPPDPLPPPARPTLLPGGAIRVDALGRSWTIESHYSEPGGKWHRLLEHPQPSWRQSRADAQAFVARTARIQVRRTLAVVGESLQIRDELHNLTDQNQPVMARHFMQWPAQDVAQLTLNGRVFPFKRGVTNNAANPTLLVEHTSGGAMAMLPIDDVFRLHHRAFWLDDKAGLADNELVLAPGARYEQVWQLYAVPSGNYWDLINSIRRTWKTNFTIPGGFAFVDIRNDFAHYTFTPQHWNQWLEQRNAIFPCVGMYHPTGGHAIHGLQFDQYPREVDDILRRAIQNIREASPDAKVLHYFHSFITGASALDKADPADRLLDPGGNHVHYGGDKLWPMFVPTASNTYGRQMTAQVQRIINALGADGIYWDEHEYSYQDYHYGQPWDGVSGLIDPETHELQRTRSHLVLISKPFRDALVEWILDAGRPLVVNGALLTTSSQRFRSYHFVETGSVTNLYNTHLFTPIGLGDHTTERSHADTIRGQMNFLDLGCVYYYYPPRMNVENPGLVRWMFPITPIALGPGYILAEERILTTRPGRFSWGGATLPPLRVHVIDPNGTEVQADWVIAVHDDMQWLELQLPRDHAAAIVRESY